MQRCRESSQEEHYRSGRAHHRQDPRCQHQVEHYVDARGGAPYEETSVRSLISKSFKTENFESSREGSIIYITSISAFEAKQGGELFEGLGMYAISKTALLALTKTAAQACIPFNIRVNSIAPGVTVTKFANVFDYQDCPRIQLINR